MHNMAIRRQKLEEAGDEAGLASFPVVTIFERSSSPGGVWKADDSQPKATCGNGNAGPSATPKDPKKDEDSATQEDSESLSTEDNESLSTEDNESLSTERLSKAEMERRNYIIEESVDSTTSMYEALWTNGPSQGIEFYDYTFQEHFKCPLPIFMPRKLLLEYMLKRVTRNNPTFFDAVKFNTTVNHVSYDDVEQMFEITTIDNASGESTTSKFHKCVWAAGINGCAKIPRQIHDILVDGNFKGIHVHSSKAAGHLSEFRGKRIVMIGDGLSAEDLALQAIKLGVKKIFIIARSGDGVCSEASAWQGKKVKVIESMVVSKVIKNGTGIRLVEKYFDPVKRDMVDLSDDEEEEETKDLEDISAVIYCTGYHPNINMVDPELFAGYENFDTKLPSDWKMKSHVLTEEIGEIAPADELEIKGGDYVDFAPGFYRGIAIENQNFMGIEEQTAQFPLLEIDIRAWYQVAVILGEITLPSKEEIDEIIRASVEEGMHLHSVREAIDDNYKKLCHEFYLRVEEEMDDWHWSYDLIDDRMVRYQKEAINYVMRRLAHETKDGNYPLQLGSLTELNEKGELLAKFIYEADAERAKIKKTSWRTFRDIDPTGFFSIHTGTPAVPLKSRWLDIDDADPHPHLSEEQARKMEEEKEQ